MSPNNQPWLREYDALIAERAEGLKTRWDNEGQLFVLRRCYLGDVWILAPWYDCNLADIARAQESWRAQDGDKRAYSMERVKGVFYARCRQFTADGPRYWVETSPDGEPGARAWALLRALKEGL